MSKTNEQRAAEWQEERELAWRDRFLADMDKVGLSRGNSPMLGPYQAPDYDRYAELMK